MRNIGILIGAVFGALGLLGLSATFGHADPAAAARYSAGAKGISFLVMHEGEIIFENYPNGGGADLPFALASGTKSFSGAIAAAAVDDGLLVLDEPVAATITEWQGDRQKSAITIRQLLQLVSGVPGGRVGQVPSYADAITVSMTAEPGRQFSYGPVPFQIFGEIMQRKLAAAGLDDDPKAYLKRRVLDPIGVQVARWRQDDDGNPRLPSGAILTARNWAKFGEFVRLGGVWQGVAMVDRDTLEAFFTGTEANPTYGLTWWLNNPVSDLQRQAIPQLRRTTDIGSGDPVFPQDLAMAAGAGNQRLYISRAEGLVIVRQASGIMAAVRGQGAQFSDSDLWRALRQ